MGGELPPDAAHLRVSAHARLRRLSATAVQPASPAGSSPTRTRAAITLDVWQPEAAGGEGMTVAGSGAAADVAAAPPGLPPLLNGAAHEASPSLGGSSDQASPRFLELLRNSLPQPDEDGDSGSGNGSSAPSAAGAQHPPPSDTLAQLHALNGGAAAAAAAGAPLANGRAPGKPHKRGLLGLFKSGKSSKQQHQAKGIAAPGASSAANGGGGSSRGSKHTSEGGGKKKGGSWFSSSKAPDNPAAKPPLPQSSPLPPAAAAEQGQRGVLLPGLPVLAAASTDGTSIRSEDAAAANGARHDSALSSRHAVASTLVDYSSASDFSAPSSALPSPVAGTLGLPPGVDAPANGKKGHSRHRSLTSMLVPGWRRRSRHPSAGSEGELAGDVTPTRGAATPSHYSSPAPKSAEALAAAAAGAAEGEMIQPILAEPRPPLLPPGTTGLRNIGNTCFVNAALQCLRYTPGLPLNVAPDLLQRVKQQQQPGGPQAAGGDELEPAAGEEVHAQALARASMDSRAPAALAASRGLEEEEEVEEGAVGSTAVASESGNAPAADEAAAGEEAAAGAEAAGAAGEGKRAEAEPAAAEAKEGSETEAGAPSEREAAAAPAAGGQPPPGPAPPPPAPPPQQQQVPAKPQRPSRGELLKAFADLVSELYLPPAGSNGSAVCATPLLRTLRAFPIAADYFDGGQHDCQEVLRVLMDLLHDDLNRAPPRQPAQPPAASASDAAAAPEAGSSPASPRQRQEEAADGPAAAAAEAQEEHPQPSPRQGEAADGAGSQQGSQQQQDEGEGTGEGKEERKEDEGAKADRLWQQYLERDSSVITDLFGGQLQSSVTCHNCGGRFTMYEPFWDLSLPLAKEAKGGSFSWLGLKGSTPASIQDCLTAFTADEKMEGAEAFHCETCRDKTPATKHLRLHRFPEVLVLQIKRFKYKGASTDKLTANVSFPLKALRLHQYASPECPAGPDECTYELFAVSNHYGNLTGGHYTAMCRVPQAGGQEAWYSFNDEQVTRVGASQVVSQYAYILFYVRSRSSTAAHHRRNHSAASAGAGGGQ